MSRFGGDPAGEEFMGSGWPCVVAESLSDCGVWLGVFRPSSFVVVNLVGVC